VRIANNWQTWCEFGGLNFMGATMIRGPRACRAIGRPALALVLCIGLEFFDGTASSQPTMKTYPSMPSNVGVEQLPAWLKANTDIAPPTVVYFSRDVIMALQHKRDLADDHVEVVVQRDALDDNAARLIGGRSDLITIEIDCNLAKYRILGVQVHGGNSLTGPVTSGGPIATWALAGASRDAAAMVLAGCEPTYVGPFAKDTNSENEPPKAQAAAASVPKPDSAKHIVVQIAAVDTEAGARKLLAETVKRWPEVAGLSAVVEVAHPGGKVTYRVSISGFASMPQANAFCAHLKASGGSCWVR
jgi:hypothetical protein